MNESFDLNHPHGHITRDGLKATFLRRLKGAVCPLLFIVQNADGNESIVPVFENGRYFDGGYCSCMDVLNAQPTTVRRTLWMNVYRNNAAAPVSYHKAQSAFPGIVLGWNKFHTEAEARAAQRRFTGEGQGTYLGPVKIEADFPA